MALDTVKIPNTIGLTFRTNINHALDAAATCFQGSDTPITGDTNTTGKTDATGLASLTGALWFDTTSTPGTLKVHNGSSFVNVNSTVTNNNQLTNGANYITSSGAPVQSVNGSTGAVSLTIPTNNNTLTNGANYITSSGAPVQSVNGSTGAVTVAAGFTWSTPSYTNSNNDSGAVTTVSGTPGWFYVESTGSVRVSVFPSGTTSGAREIGTSADHGAIIYIQAGYRFGTPGVNGSAGVKYYKLG